MLLAIWRLTEPLDTIIFDCDGILSHIEDINYLAASNHFDSDVRLLTEIAMNLIKITLDIYRNSLDLVRLTAEQVVGLDDYYVNLTLNAEKVISTFQNRNKPVYIVSAGIKRAVEAFSKRLGIPTSYVFGVDV
ncbi:hypothetical protein [Coxiella-like endosymbiont of Rhipicephalus sanguineus]|uniref:hypothetical protein n=1 Tax=Coxiella-like endosymbiont of Rhipicephalus sanguineus TaxID=1955402 RepID=UPI0020410C9A|nr:hypothetical protein [Coxiella-like endosymbiont of Rhipicephalus sanguineus]